MLLVACFFAFVQLVLGKVELSACGVTWNVGEADSISSGGDVSVGSVLQTIYHAQLAKCEVIALFFQESFLSAKELSLLSSRGIFSGHLYMDMHQLVGFLPP